MEDKSSTGIWRELAEYARWAPSPHNTQPARIRVVDDERAELYFVPARGLPVGDPVGRFTHLTFGIVSEILRIAAHARGYELKIRWVKELNRDVLFHDLEHATYRRELAGWLRYSDAEAADRRDGLSARAMLLPGWLLKAFFHRHRLFLLPGLKQVARRIYLATMRGISTVAWIQGDYVTPADWTSAGHLMIRIWLILTRHGVSWQPYGSVITNDDARRAMVDKFGITEGSDGAQMVWLLVRMGYSGKTPVRSERLPLEEVLI